MSEEMFIVSVGDEVSAGNFRCQVLISGEEKDMIIPSQALQEIGIPINESAFQEGGWKETMQDMTAGQCSSKEAMHADADWKTNETKLLLDKYSTYLDKVGPMKRFRTKKAMWNQISEDISDILGLKRSAIQCENRYKTVMKRKKAASQNNNTSGCSRQTVEFEEEIRSIAAVDDSLQPEVLRGVDRVVINKKQSASPYSSLPGSSSSSSSSPPPPSSCQLSQSLSLSPPSPVLRRKTRKEDKNEIKELLMHLHNLKEEAKERRHREKMEILKDMLKKE